MLISRPRAVLDSQTSPESLDITSPHGWGGPSVFGSSTLAEADNLVWFNRDRWACLKMILHNPGKDAHISHGPLEASLLERLPYLVLMPTVGTKMAFQL